SRKRQDSSVRTSTPAPYASLANTAIAPKPHAESTQNVTPRRCGFIVGGGGEGSRALKASRLPVRPLVVLARVGAELRREDGVGADDPEESEETDHVQMTDHTSSLL